MTLDTHSAFSSHPLKRSNFSFWLLYIREHFDKYLNLYFCKRAAITILVSYFGYSIISYFNTFFLNMWKDIEYWYWLKVLGNEGNHFESIRHGLFKCTSQKNLLNTIVVDSLFISPKCNTHIHNQIIKKTHNAVNIWC